MASPIEPARQTGQGRALCISARREGADVGAAMLRAGGNAFDAVAAAGFMECVIAPAMCGIGGYGATGIAFLGKDQKTVTIDANSVAPGAARPSMFPVLPTRDPEHYRLANSNHKKGPLSVGVPGVLGGLLTLVETWGKLGRRAVLAPAIRAAREGVRLTPGNALTWRTLEAESEGKPAPNRSEIDPLVTMPQLADSLELIAKDGRDAFYRGPIAQAIVSHLRALGGILTLDELSHYEVLQPTPLEVTLRGYRILTPPPASGGLSCLQMVALLDRLESSGSWGAPASPQAFHAWLEVQKVVWTERLTRLADPRSMDAPPSTLLEPSSIDRLLRQVREGIARPNPGRVIAPDPLRGTSHLLAADAEGNVVSWTQTHGGGFGSNVMVKGTGIVLGHGMCRFEPRPGWANSVAPGKRPLHNMCPCLVVKDGKAVFALGAAGGRTIVNNVAAILASHLIQKLDAPRAVAAPRLQCESAEPATLERSVGEPVIAAIRAKGHELQPANRDAGVAHVLASADDGWLGAGEPRVATSTVALA